MADNDSKSDNATYSTKARSLKKPRSNSATSYLKCIIRQADGEETLRRPFLFIYRIFISKLKIRKEDVSGRLANEITKLQKSFVVWRSPCYSSYTCNENIQYALKRSKNESKDQNEEGNLESIQDNRRRCLRSTASTNDWCKKCTLKKNREMLIISMFEACETIMNAGKSNWDEVMLHILRGVNNDLVAADAKCHKACHASYVKKKKAENQFQKRIWRGKLVSSSSIKRIGWWNKTGPRSWRCVWNALTLDKIRFDSETKWCRWPAWVTRCRNWYWDCRSCCFPLDSQQKLRVGV